MSTNLPENQRLPFWLVVIGLLLATTAPVNGDNKENKGKNIERMMERVHEGRRSPFRKTKSELAAQQPDWNILGQQLPALQEMAGLLLEARQADIRDAAGGYADAVKSLGASTAKQDLAGARKAFGLLSASCADCHYKGGPGGRLDDD